MYSGEYDAFNFAPPFLWLIKTKITPFELAFIQVN
jgi:hypothetical protein